MVVELSHSCRNTEETGEGVELSFLTETYNLDKQLQHSIIILFSLRCTFAKDSMQPVRASQLSVT